MKRELLLLRHGKSDWSVDAADFERPLKERGKRGAQQIGAWLSRQGLFPDHVVSSPAERALATARRTVKAMGGDPQRVHEDRRVYAADVEDLLAVLAGCPPQVRRVMLVGHNPGLELLLLHLTGGELDVPDDGKLLPTATLARLKMPRNWSDLEAGCARLLSLTRSRNLPSEA